ncbi:MAG: nickel/cobalt transporter (NicO) family protein, partial [Actinomycetota bacterium]|nr:nickel/cobalt transporter (NicO) family protein [Actinomycetota bacterium]
MLRRAMLLWFSVLSLLALAPAPASAHPLGNFTINVFSGLEISRTTVTVHHIVDMAEIPTYQELPRISAPGGMITEGLDDYAQVSAKAYAKNITVEADGEKLPLSITWSSAELRPGQGGLQTLWIDTTYVVRLPQADTTIAYQDLNFADRLGWKEIVAVVQNGQGLVSSSVPTDSVSNELTTYPKDKLSSPLDQRDARVEVRPGATGTGATPTKISEGNDWSGALGARFTSLIERDATPGFLAVALLLALAAGALHALGPGHGKTIMAAYLVGADGKGRHALTIGVAVSLMHTLSVVALGVITLSASRLFPPEEVYPWLAFASGVVVL